MSSLFKLPPEIRQRIYEDILVVGKVFPYTLGESYDEYECDYDDELTERELACYEAPEVGLLLVCKTIHAEAEPLLYRRNTFVLPPSDLTARFFNRSLHNDTRRGWIKSVEVSFEASDLTRDDREATLDEQLELTRDDMLFPEKGEGDAWLHPDVDNWAQNMHESYKECLSLVVWPRKAAFILDHLQLRELVVDFGAATCIEDCCCIRKHGIQAMAAGFAKGLPEILKLVGLYGATVAAEGVIRLGTSMRLSRIPLCKKVEAEEEMASLREFIDLELEII